MAKCITHTLVHCEQSKHNTDTVQLQKKLCLFRPSEKWSLAFGITGCQTNELLVQLDIFLDYWGFGVIAHPNNSIAPV